MPAELNGARVLLTGATGGIGNAIARGLHGRGAQRLPHRLHIDLPGALPAARLISS